MSPNQIELLRRQRESITLSLLQCQLLRNNYREARKITGECREKLYYYLGRQDEKFYADLTEIFKDNRPAIKIIEFLRVDIKDIRIKTFEFFEKYGVDNPLEQGRNFARDLREYRQILLDRFRMEEDYLISLLKSTLTYEKQAL